MRLPYEWLREFVDIYASPEELAERLTMIGLEVEGVESVNGDTVFEVNVTPNRPDCLSILGIAREVSAVFNVPFEIPTHEITDKLNVSDFSVEIVRPELCNRYTGRVIKGVKIADSPEWLKSRLEKCGIRSINNVVDITNYVLLELGHPLHAFDADTINGKKIIIDTAGVKSKIVTLDGIERELPEKALLIWDKLRPVAIAGVMGGLETEVSEGTKNIFLESAYFTSFSVRRTSKTLNLSSESSYRFERGTDVEFLKNALDRAALMIKDIAGGTIYELIDNYPVKYVPESVSARFENINKILGTNLSHMDMLEILKRLGIQVEEGREAFVIYPPAFRRDIQGENDIAEEVARFYGYEKVPITIPKSTFSAGMLNTKKMYVNRVSETMRKTGFTEVINYSFMSPTSLNLINIPETDRRRNTIVIRNPLRQEESLLRTTLAPSLIENFKYNFDRGVKNIKFFEIARIFEDSHKTLPLEELKLGGLCYRDKSPSLWREDTKGFFIVKGVLESLFEDLLIKDYSFSPTLEAFLHKGQSADIYVSGSYIGYIGVLSPEVVERLDLKKQKPEIVMYELNLDLLLTKVPDSIRYNPIPKYPYIERDIAVIVDKHISAYEIEKIINSFPSQFIEDLSVFDSYVGGNIPEGKKSLAFNIIYRSKDKTLTDNEVENIHNSLVDYILKKTGGELRG